MPTRRIPATLIAPAIRRSYRRAPSCAPAFPRRTGYIERRHEPLHLYWPRGQPPQCCRQRDARYYGGDRGQFCCSDVPSAALRFRPSSLVPHQLPLAPRGFLSIEIEAPSPARYKSPLSPQSEQALDRRLTRPWAGWTKWQVNFLGRHVEIPRVRRILAHLSPLFRTNRRTDIISFNLSMARYVRVCPPR
jgi:hypothetical protein